MSIKKKLDDILERKAFDQLLEYTEPSSWQSMNETEKELLGLLFISQGEHQMLNGDNKGISSFDLATQIAPQSSQVHYRQAFAYATQKNNIIFLKKASAALDKAVTLDPSHLNAWQSWANLLVNMGIMQDNSSWLYQANEKFNKIQDLIKIQNQPSNTAELTWQWAKCWFHIGKHSGEASDFFQSVEKFRQAAHHGCDHHSFYHDFGNTLADLADLLKRKDLLIEAASHFHKSTSAAPHEPEGWLRLGHTYQQLHRYDPHPNYFQQSDECFKRAVDMTPHDSNLWSRWAELCVHNGTSTNNIEDVKDSIEKFAKADSLDPHNPAILLPWAEALIFMAAHHENLELINEAESKVLTAIHSTPEDPLGWYWYGICRSELGRYFSTESYYRQAIEKFQYALLLTPSNPHILYHIGLAHFSLGDLLNNPSILEEGLEFFKKCATYQEGNSPQFLNDWGVALMKLGEITHEKAYIEEAVAKFDDAIGLCTQTSEEVDLEWLYNYGCAMDFLGDFQDESIYYEKAIQILSYVVEKDPQQQDAQYHLALALFHNGELNSDIDQLHQSIRLFHEITQDEQEDEIMWNDYGLALLNLAVLIDDAANSEESRHLLEQAENKLQRSSALGNKYSYYNLACVHALIGNISSAMHYMERAESCNAIPPLAELMNDEWLENLQSQPVFRQFISRLILKHKENQED